MGPALHAKVLGSSSLIPSKGPGFWVPGPAYESRVLGPRWRVLGPGSWVPDPGSHFSGMLCTIILGNLWKLRSGTFNLELWQPFIAHEITNSLLKQSKTNLEKVSKKNWILFKERNSKFFDSFIFSSCFQF